MKRRPASYTHRPPEQNPPPVHYRPSIHHRPHIAISNQNARQMARIEQQRRKAKRLKIVIGIAAGIAALLIIIFTVFTIQQTLAIHAATATPDTQITNPATKEQQNAPTALELRQNEAIAAGADPADPNLVYLPTPLVAKCRDVGIHSMISANNLTEVEYHQASYDTAIKLTPLLTILDAEKVINDHGTTRPPADQQPTGDAALIGSAVSTWRLDSVGDEMTCVDVGALTGTTVYAPVTGTVVKIKTYSLYGEIDDYEMHIQMPGHPELDVVVLHITDLTVDVGSKVIGGVTPIGVVRDISVAIDNNLSNFTASDDPGNHAHVQVNDATREDYKGLEGAINIF